MTPTLLVCLLLFCAPCFPAAAQAQTVVLIGGAASEGPGRHDYPNGIRALQAAIAASPELRGLRVAAYPGGWPDDPHAFDDAATVLLYFDGLDKHPLRDPKRRAALAATMQRGVGLIALHQSSTVLPDDDFDLPRLLGAARRGMFDRTTEWAQLAPVSAHPVTRGIAGIEYRDEFYPTFVPWSGEHPIQPILAATLHPQFRDGHALIEEAPEQTTVAWTFERADGGRSFVYTGAHFLAALGEPGVRTLLMNAVLWTAKRDVPSNGAHIAASNPAAAPVAFKKTALRPARASFHVDAQRSGWRADERVLTPTLLANPTFGQVWESTPLDGPDGEPARLYASPLYVEGVTMTRGQHRDATFSVVFAATNHGDVVAINAAPGGDVAPGRILWRTRLGDACRLQPAPLDGVPSGILSTPVIDIARGRLYVTHCDPVQRWQAYAIDITSGDIVPGWPVRLDEDTFNAVNRNAGPERVPPKRKFDFRVQRGALNLSPDGSRLYAVFGETETGWIASVDTNAATVDSAFAAVAMPHRGSGGIWGAGGPAVDARGNVYVVTGSGFDGYQDAPHDWAQSLLQLSQPGVEGFTLRGTYTPFNYCGTAKMDIDLGSGGAMLLPARDGAQLLAIGGKQGNVVLLDAAALPGRLDRRPACSTDAASDGSLLAPQPQPQFGTHGPLNVFGPYSEEDAALDLARARSVPAAFRDASGRDLLFVTGNTKAAAGWAQSVPPSIVRLAVEREEAASPYLRIDASNKELVLANPGSPVVTSNGAADAVVWVLDENAPRSAQLAGVDAPRPALYAFDANTLDVLWQSAPGALFTSGKYNEPAFGGGLVFVGTDRIQAFGIGGTTLPNREPRASAQTQASALSSTAQDGETLYAERCAMCHDHPQGNIPPRAVLATRSHARIVEALTHGVMRAQAAGLTDDQIERVARFLQ